MALTKVTGSVIKDSVSLSGNVSVGGTLTYQDVTNVDALGIGTFRTGIKVLAGQVDVGSNIKLGNAGVITATSFSGSGANLTGIDTDILSDTSPQLGGDLDTNSHEILLDDDHKIKFGDGADMNIRHTGTYGILENSTGALYLRSSSFIEMRGNNNETFIKATENGAVELYHNNEKTFETIQHGVQVTDNDTSVQINMVNSNGTIGYLYGGASGEFGLLDGQGHFTVKGYQDGAVELYHDNEKKLNTTAGGVTVTGDFNATTTITSGEHLKVSTDTGKIYAGASNDARMYHDGTNTYFDSVTGHLYLYSHPSSKSIIFGTVGTSRASFTDSGHFQPWANNTYDLGSSSYRWRNVYTNDLNLSNEGSTNSVDNTWGDFTIQEGESDLFLINNRNGKKYKFNLTEVS